MSGGLNNADFRKMLAEGRLGTVAKEKREKAKEKYAKKAKARNQKMEKLRAAGDAEEEEGEKYRDRAAERRQGLRNEYEEDEQQLQSIYLAADENLTEEERRQRAYELSKHLGGTESATHLVRGLDKTLLERMRDNLRREQDNEAAAAQRAEQSRSLAESTTFRTPLGRSVFEALFRRAGALGAAAQRFLPRRMAFVYDLDDDGSGPTGDAPSTLLRPKADCPRPPETLMGMCDAGVLDRISRAMRYIVDARKKKTKKDAQAVREILSDAPGAGQPAAPAVVAQPAAEKPAGPVDEEEDIFGDAGTDYVCDVKPKAKTGSKARDKLGGSVFGDGGAAREDRPERASAQATAGLPSRDALPPPPPPGDAPPEALRDARRLEELTRDERDAGLASVWRSDDAAWRRRDRSAIRREFEAMQDGRMEVDDDGYGIDMGGAGFAPLGAEDEEDLSQADTKGAARRELGRADFATEGEYEKYKMSREAVPSVAYQFGVKGSDGRKSAKQMRREAERKLDKGLKEVEKIMREKGTYHEGAFGGGDRGGDGDGDAGRRRQKRLKI
ncbi:unnamed protein product [Pedinophyceae sp. YPF-701]|nr:unnamed protein product [Pedinophyceae sp. YPF-701]